jgi:tRNA 2-thiouridine synthesizing protein A
MPERTHHVTAARQPAFNRDFDAELDCSGLLCPLPVYQTSLALRQLSSGDVLHLVTTDPGAIEDIPALVRQWGDDLLDSERTDTNQSFWIKKGQRP